MGSSLQLTLTTLVEGQKEHQQVPDKLPLLVSNTETAVLAVAVAQAAISDAEYAIISSQFNAIRGHSGVDVTLNRLRNEGYTQIFLIFARRHVSTKIYLSGA
jgi:hypothetical protein